MIFFPLKSVLHLRKKKKFSDLCGKNYAVTKNEQNAAKEICKFQHYQDFLMSLD